MPDEPLEPLKAWRAMTEPMAAASPKAASLALALPSVTSPSAQPTITSSAASGDAEGDERISATKAGSNGTYEEGEVVRG